jgi:hypothetical protein
MRSSSFNSAGDDDRADRSATRRPPRPAVSWTGLTRPRQGHEERSIVSFSHTAHRQTGGRGSVPGQGGGVCRCEGFAILRANQAVPFYRSVLALSGGTSGRAPYGTVWSWGTPGGNPSTPALATDRLPGAARALRDVAAKALRLHSRSGRAATVPVRSPVHRTGPVAVVSLVRHPCTSLVASRAALRLPRFGTREQSRSSNQKGTI